MTEETIIGQTHVRRYSDGSVEILGGDNGYLLIPPDQCRRVALAIIGGITDELVAHVAVYAVYGEADPELTARLVLNETFYSETPL